MACCLSGVAKPVLGAGRESNVVGRRSLVTHLPSFAASPGMSGLLECTPLAPSVCRRFWCGRQPLADSGCPRAFQNQRHPRLVHPPAHASESQGHRGFGQAIGFATQSVSKRRRQRLSLATGQRGRMRVQTKPHVIKWSIAKKTRESTRNVKRHDLSK